MAWVFYECQHNTHLSFVYLCCQCLSSVPFSMCIGQDFVCVKNNGCIPFDIPFDQKFPLQSWMEQKDSGNRFKSFSQPQEVVLFSGNLEILELSVPFSISTQFNFSSLLLESPSRPKRWQWSAFTAIAYVSLLHTTENYDQLFPLHTSLSATKFCLGDHPVYGKEIWMFLLSSKNECYK